MNSYKVKYRNKSKCLWRTLNGVKEDGFVVQVKDYPIRYFVLERDIRIEIPAADTEFKIFGRMQSGSVAGVAPVNTSSEVATQTVEKRVLTPKQEITRTSVADLGGGYTRLAQVLFWLGDYSSEAAEKERYFAEGVEHGKKAVELSPNDAAAHLWYASNMGQHGTVRGIMSSLFYLGPMEKHGKKALELDENYFHAAPLRFLGRFYHKAPGWPVGSGDVDKGIGYLKRAMELAPDFLFNAIYLADAYISKRKYSEARQLLESVVATPEPQTYTLHYQMAQRDAQELLGKI